MRATRIVLLGPPTAGKSSLSYLAAARFQIPQMNLGEELRRRALTDRDLRAQLAEANRAPDALIESVLRPKLASPKGYILDGFPRTISQLQAFDSWPEADGARFALLDLDLSRVPARFMSRANCARCSRAEYGRTTCGRCGGDLAPRGDISQAAFEAKLRAYIDGELPLIEELANRRRVRKIIVRGSIEEDLPRLIGTLAPIVASGGFEQEPKR